MHRLIDGGRRVAKGARRGYALIVALALLALGMGTAVVMLRSSDLSIRSTVRDDLKDRADRAAESALSLGLDVLRRRSWTGVGWEFSGSWIDGAAFRVRYLAGDASLTPGSPDYAFLPYRVTIEATATAIDPSDALATISSTASVVVELVPEKLQGELPGWSERADYAFFQFRRFGRNGEVKLDLPFQFVGKTRLSEPIKEWRPSVLKESSPRDAYFDGLRQMAQAGFERRYFAGDVEYRFADQPASFRADVARLGRREIDAVPVAQTYFPAASVASYQLYPGGPAYAIPSFNATYGSSPRNVTASADPLTNPLGIFRLTSSIVARSNVQVTGMLLSASPAVSVTVEGDDVAIGPPFAMAVGERSLSLALQSLMASERLIVKKHADDVVFRGTVGVWDLAEFEEASRTQDVTIEGGLQANQIFLHARKEFKDAAWSAWHDDWREYRDRGGSLPFPIWAEWTRSLPSEPRIVFRSQVSGATQKFLFDPSRPLYDYPDATSGLNWRIVRFPAPK